MHSPAWRGFFFDPRFDYFVRRKESQNCEFGDCSFRADCAQPSIIKGLQVSSKPCLKKAYSRAENFQAAAHGNSNLIVVGLSDRNSVLKQINPYLHFQYTDDMTSLAESTKLVMTTDYAHEASVLQLMKSPYNETMALLTASAVTEAGLQNLMARLSTEKNRWSLGKEALVVDGYGGASSYQFTVSTALTQNAEKPSFADVIVQNREPMTLLLVGMGCMLVLLLATVLLLVRIHHRRKYDDK